MASQLLILKGLASVGGAAAVGGGSYVVYQNSDSIKNIFVRKKTDESTSTNQTTPNPITTNLFVVRYKSDAPSTSTTLTTPSSLTCTIAPEEVISCKIYQFGDSPKFDNVINTTNTSTLKEVTAVQSLFVANSHLVIELTGTTKTAAELQNKTITLKKDQTDLGKFDFDQILTGESATTAAPLTAAEETYIVKKATDWTTSNATGATSYRCKFSGGSGKSENHDSTCQLIKLAPKTSDTIVDFEHLKSLTTKITPATLATDTATDSYYKLIVNKDLLYNLTFSEAVTPQIQIELLNQANTSIGSVDLKQKLEDTSFIGKTDLLLGKVLKTPTDAVGTLTAATCSFSTTPPTATADQIGCTLHKATQTEGKTIQQTTLSSASLQAADTVAINDYFVIKFTTEQTISSLNAQDKIYYHIPSTGSAPQTTKTIELSLEALMSGEFDSSKTPIFITEPKTSAQTTKQ